MVVTGFEEAEVDLRGAISRSLRRRIVLFVTLS